MARLGLFDVPLPCLASIFYLGSNSAVLTISYYPTMSIPSLALPTIRSSSSSAIARGLNLLCNSSFLCIVLRNPGLLITNPQVCKGGGQRQQSSRYLRLPPLSPTSIQPDSAAIIPIDFVFPHNLQPLQGSYRLPKARHQPWRLRDLVDSTAFATWLRERWHNKAQRLGGEGEASVPQLQAHWRPWIKDKRMKKTRYNNLIVYIFMVIGFGVAGYICFAATQSVPKHDYCLILDEDFKTLDENIWNHEVQVDGFGTGSFDWTTKDPQNSFVDAEGLHIVPTLTNQSTPITNEQISNGFTVNLTADGTCTSNSVFNCAIRSNNTLGYTIPPVRSARLNTKGKKSIRYGKVEITAKMPQGDWLWPALWLVPQDDVYGIWPRSGEIDIAEVRGNAPGYPLGGRDTYTSTIHWGPTSDLNAFWRTTAGRQIRRTDFSKSFHTFGFEWSGDYMYTYLDSRLQQVLYVGIVGKHTPKNFWERGDFGDVFVNNTLLPNPWAKSPNPGAPFDQEFYLVMNVAVGSRNGWFLDGVGGKPWVDASTYLAPGAFYQRVDDWLPTWGEGNARGMTVKSVKMWQEGACK
ncbi:hypothetical protein O988_01777 [Pseudogymnoascus sp. VKM F-3808]|nr:hypothetical protein O988_01777 [Pseudogymnoascus sp. VKM F-3808]